MDKDKKNKKARKLEIGVSDRKIKFSNVHFKTSNIRVDNWVFRLNYFSVFIVLFFILVYVLLSFKSPVQCFFHDGCIGPERVWNKGYSPDAVKAKDKMDLLQENCDEKNWYEETFLVDFCWTIQGALHTYPELINNKTDTVKLSPGVGDAGGMGFKKKDHIYYQWLPAILLFQFFMFRLPRILWKSVENGRMKSLCKDLMAYLMVSKDRILFQKALSDYLVERLNSPRNKRYAHVYVFCEFLNLLCTVINLFLLDYIADHEFSKMGLRIVSLKANPLRFRQDALASLFPLSVKCNFTDFGQGGGRSKFGLCVLPFNAISEYYFILMWYYFLLLAVVNCFLMIFRMSTIFFPCVRRHLLDSASPFTSPIKIKRIVEHCSFSEWFILCQIGQNIEGSVYHEVIDEYAERMEIREAKTHPVLTFLLPM